MTIYWSTGAFLQKTLDEIMSFCLAHGIHTLELSSGVEYHPRLLEPVRAQADRMQYLVHNYFPPPADPFVLNLASCDPLALEQSLEHCHTAIDLSVELGAPFFSVHSGFAFNLTPDLLGDPVAQSRLPDSSLVSYEAAYEVFVRSIFALVEYADSKGIRLLVENNVVSPLYLDQHGKNALLMASADEICRLIQDIQHPKLGVLVDTGHVNVTATALGFSRKRFVEALAPYIGAFHLSDNDGVTDQNLPFDRNAWFYPLLNDFADVPMVIEAYRLSWEQMQRQIQVWEG